MAGTLTRLFIVATLLLAAVLGNMVLAGSAFQFRPDFTSLMVIYWSLYAPRHFGIGLAWGSGLVQDFMGGSGHGLHAMSHALLAYFFLRWHLQIPNFGHLRQMGAVFLALLAERLLVQGAHLITGAFAFSWPDLIGPMVGALLWPIVRMTFDFSRKRLIFR